MLCHLSFIPLAAWPCVGDFNAILTDSEKWGVSNQPCWQMRDFQKTLEHYQLQDLGYNGSKFTWTNKQEGDSFIQERLDRATVSPEWSVWHPGVYVEIMAARSSDHAPINIVLHGEGRIFRRKK